MASERRARGLTGREHHVLARPSLHRGLSEPRRTFVCEATLTVLVGTPPQHRRWRGWPKRRGVTARGLGPGAQRADGGPCQLWLLRPLRRQLRFARIAPVRLLVSRSSRLFASWRSENSQRVRARAPEVARRHPGGDDRDATPPRRRASSRLSAPGRRGAPGVSCLAPPGRHVTARGPDTPGSACALLTGSGMRHCGKFLWEVPRATSHKPDKSSTFSSLHWHAQRGSN
jgi:hypothetical protein